MEALDILAVLFFLFDLLLIGIFAYIFQINKQLKTIMATLQELNDKVTELQAAVDAEQQQIADLLATNASVIVDLNTQITALQAQLEGAATPEALQVILDGLNAIKADVEGTVTPPTE